MKPMLARDYDDYFPDATGWWMSEKLDGVRAIWNGTDFVSRNGKVFPAPDYMKRQMPDVMLDGELFCGRGQFQTTISNVKSGKWLDIDYKVFDVIDDAPFEARQATLRALDLPCWCEVVEQVQCLSSEHLEQFEDSILSDGGEGVMLRKPGSLYTHGRSMDLLKIKRFQSDEAEVIGYEDGKGRNAGRVGALIARYAGQMFKLGTGLTDAERENPPSIGSLVTFSFFGLTDAGKPRHPVFFGVRDYE